jgi:hypothetical protein
LLSPTSKFSYSKTALRTVTFTMQPTFYMGVILNMIENREKYVNRRGKRK